MNPVPIAWKDPRTGETLFRGGRYCWAERCERDATTLRHWPDGVLSPCCSDHRAPINTTLDVAVAGV